MAGRRWFVLTLSLILIIGLSIPAGAQLLPLTFPQSIPVILQIAPTASITTIANALGGATVVDSIPGANTYLLNLPLILPTLNLSLLGGIQSAELNLGVSLPGFAVLGLVRIPGTVAQDWYKNQPSWQLIEAQKALPYSTGNAIVVADINSQVDYQHPALVGHLTSSTPPPAYDFVANKPGGSTALNQSDASFLDQSDASFLDQSDASFLDQYLRLGAVLDLPDLTVNPAYSHGTLCAGVIAAIAPGSKIMPLRAFNDNGQSDLFTLAKAIRYAADNGAQVINMSFGTNYPSRTLQSAVQYAQHHNVLLAASAGNNNTSRPQYPAAYSGVMTTAATDLGDQKAAFSNYGSDIFVDAPGVNIISAYPGGYYSIVSGTSFSAPTVAGTAALVRSLRMTGVANSIAGGAVNINQQNPNYVNQLGHGRIDVLRAVKPN
jgi:subtilisin family serine protease